MRQALLRLFLYAVLLLPLGAAAAGYQTPAITAADLKGELGTSAAPLVIDVRDPVEYKAAHVPGAINVPERDLEMRLDEIDPAKGVVLYCIAGYRTKRAEKTLLEHHVPNVLHLQGGLGSWINKGYKVDKGPAP